MAASILIERDGPVLTIVNNDPSTRNALSPELYVGLRQALADAAAAASVAAVILTGAAGFFCAGGNLNVLKTRADMPLDARRQSIEGLHDMIRAIRDCPRPVIAAIEGGAAGAGASLALACDLIVAAEDAYFAVSYIRVGLSPDGGATAFLSEFAPRQLVNEILMFGDKIAVERLYRLGAINRMTKTGQTRAVAQALGERLNGMGPNAVASAKRLAQSARGNDLEAQMALEADAMAEAQGHPEAAEGISAFLGKNTPDFTKFRR